MEEDALKKAISLYREGQISAARTRLEEIVRLQPNNVRALLWLTACQVDKKVKEDTLAKVRNLQPEIYQILRARDALQRMTPPNLPEWEEIWAIPKESAEAGSTQSRTSQSIQTPQAAPQPILGCLVVIIIVVMLVAIAWWLLVFH
ncbi:MAG: hypothetical protein L0Z70_06570 [Chloroflexi bacterium]|nr:hypothetical protein [Chloroflexota bacterium]